MCGICGIWGKSDRDFLKTMMKKINHRGPDGRGITEGNCFSFGHIRLSIIDVDGGLQPIANEDGSLILIFNGEIYNFKNLKSRLINHEFKTSSDSEVILHLFEDIGKDIVKELDGMFAFAICGHDRVFLARDPLGIKPLYFGYDCENNLFFASEIKALLKVTKKIHEFPAGSYFDSKTGFNSFYSIPQAPENFSCEVKDIVQKTSNVLETAVEKRLMSDVPLGVFLSGGLDSSLISSITKKYTSRTLHSFAVGTAGSSDIEYSKEAAKFIGTKHHAFIFEKEDVIKNLEEVIYFLESYDPALVRSAIPTYMVSKVASEYVKVVLSGEGADELFGGYHYLKEFSKSDMLLHSELINITGNLHNTNLQRVDRMTMANSIEGRVPFLDIELIKNAFNISPKLKMFKNKYNLTEKWILRNIAEKYLPKEFVWRKKEKFAVGCGTASILENYADEKISDKEFKKANYKEIKFKSKEELLYFKILDGFYSIPYIDNLIGKSRSLNPGVIYN